MIVRRLVCWFESRRVLSTFVAAAYAAVIFVLSHQPVLPAPGFPFVDLIYHFTVYLGFGFVVFLAARSWGVKKWQIAFAVCVVYAFSDELHQVFVPGRVFSLNDIVFDLIGSVAGIRLYEKFV